MGGREERRDLPVQLYPLCFLPSCTVSHANIKYNCVSLVDKLQVSLDLGTPVIW